MLLAKLHGIPLKPLLAGILLAIAANSVISSGAIAAPVVDGSASPHFDINRFDVRGNTVLSQQEVDSLVAPFTGRQREFADLVKAQEALEAAFHARGYKLVRVDLPEQEIDKGVVVLNVVQSRIGRVTVEGNRHFDEANVRHSLPGLQEGKAPDLNAISKSLKLANENPAKKTVMTMKSGAQDDEVDATLAVSDEPAWTTTVNVDNTGTAQTGRTYAGVVLQNANLFGLDHVLSMQYTTSVEQPSRVSVYGIGYHVPLYALGDSMDFFGSYSDVDTGTVTAGIFDLAVSGRGTVFGARYNHNLPASGNFESKLVYGVDYKAYRNSVRLLGADIGNDITVHPLSVGYLGTWATAGGQANIGLTLLHNISGGSDGSQKDFDDARFDASAEYTALRYAASVTKTLPADWLMRAIINGQYTDAALIPGEQFGAGGASSVRGYEERELANDSGATANLEVYTPPLCKDNGWQCRMLAFYDLAHLTRNHALPGETRSSTISGVGLGVRLLFRNDINFQMDYGHALRDGLTTRDGDDRLHVRLGLTF